jgi:hypothetical protein
MAKAAPVSASSSTSTLGASPPSVRAKRALEHFNRAQDALKDQDWARYGEELKKMRGVPSEGGQVRSTNSPASRLPGPDARVR